MKAKPSASARCAARVAWLAALGLPWSAPAQGPGPRLRIEGEAELFAPDIASTDHSEIRLTLSPDGRTALWFSRDRPGGAGGYDIWMSHRDGSGWSPAEPVPFNSPGRDFDPAFSPDGQFVHFCSDRPGGFGGDDIYRVSLAGRGFGAAVNLGRHVNSAGDEFAPMLSPDGTRLLFSSDRGGGAGGHDLFTARRSGQGFLPARRLKGPINTAADEFDPTFLHDGSTIVFARAMDLRTDRVDLFQAAPIQGEYGFGDPVAAINNDHDTYGAMLDWSAADRLTFSGQRRARGGMDLFLVRYSIAGR